MATTDVKERLLTKRIETKQKQDMKQKRATRGHTARQHETERGKARRNEGRPTAKPQAKGGRGHRPFSLVNYDGSAGVGSVALVFGLLVATDDTIVVTRAVHGAWKSGPRNETILKQTQKNQLR